MAIQKIRQYGNRAIPTLKDKLEFVDIVNDVTTGGTTVPLSAEMGKSLKSDVNQEISDRSQAIVDLKGGVTPANATLGKIEINLNQEIADRTQADSDALVQSTADIKVESDRALAAELVLTNAVAKEISDRDIAVVAEKNRAVIAEGTLQTNLNTVESAYKAADVVTTKKINDDVSAEASARATEDTRIDTALVKEIGDRESAITQEISDRDAAILIETNRAKGAESILSTAVSNEANRADLAEVALSGRVDTLTTTVSTNKTAIDGALASEVANRISADDAHSTRLAAIEGGLVAGVIWKGSVATLGDIDALAEADLSAGWAYYVSDEKDVYVVLPDNGGDYVPSTFTTKSFLKIADFKELTGLVNTEKARALGQEAVITGNLSTEVSTRSSEITRVEGLISSEESTRISEIIRVEGIVSANLSTHANELDAEVLRADTAEKLVQSNLDTVEQNYKASDVAMEIAYKASDLALKTAYELADTNLQDNIDALSASTDTAVATEKSRALTAELVLRNDLAQEVTDRGVAVVAEKDRAELAESILRSDLVDEIANRKADVDTEEVRAIAAENALDVRLDVVEGDKTVVGSIAKAEQDAKEYTDKWTPMMKLEGANGQLTVVGDSITVSYAPMNDGVIFGEVIVYGGDNDSEAIAVSVSNITGSSITLDVVTAGEFDGKNCKVQYMFREGDQVGAGMGVAGENGAGA